MGVPVYVFDYPEAQAVAAAAGLRPDLVLAPCGSAVTGQPPARPLLGPPFVAINGSGNHHHETMGLVSALIAADPDRRFTYVHVDAHPDTGELYRWRYNCASFVGRILESPSVEAAYLLGINPEVLAEETQRTVFFKNLHYYHCDYFAKVRQFTVLGGPIDETYFGPAPEDLGRAKKNPSVQAARLSEVTPPKHEQPFPALVVKWRALSEFQPSTLPRLPLYVSVDLDVLKVSLVTDWRKSPKRSGPTRFGVPENQGEMSLEVLLELLRELGGARPILGADVCGLTHALSALSAEAREESLAANVQVLMLLRELVGAQPGATARAGPSRRRSR